MCPVCLAAIGQIVAVAATTGGLATLALKVTLTKKNAGEIAPKSNGDLADAEKRYVFAEGDSTR
jgi:hypothetical protein